MNTDALKNQLRQQLKALVIDQELKNAEENILLAKAKAYLVKNLPQVIGLYSPLASEVNITPLHDFCRLNAIKTAYPSIENGLMLYRLVDDLKDLQINNLGFLQPLPKHPSVSPYLIIVPGLAFNKSGARLGRGKGHFDRYLAAHCPKTLAPAFSWMTVNNIPLQSHDKLIDMLITPT